MEEKYYTCKYDRAFKEVMLKEENKNILKELLEFILKVKINEIEIKNIERNTSNLKIKRKYFDCLLKTDVGKIGIEINSNGEKEYVRPRNMAYISDMYASHTLVGKEYNEEVEIIQINLSYELKSDKLRNEYYVQTDDHERFVSNLKIIEINMEKYKEMWYSKNRKEIEENKILVMLDLEKEELKELSKKDKVVSQYMKELDKINEDIEFRQYMSHEEDEKKIFNSLVREATTKGLEQGLKEGLKQGLEQGKEQGAYEKQKEIVKELIKINMSLEQISQVTKLSEIEIKEISNEINN